jgi:hypothetical protein
MLVSRTSAVTILNGFKGWMGRRRTALETDIEAPESSDIVGESGRLIPFREGTWSDRRRCTEQNRWPLGPSLDNFS